MKTAEVVDVSDKAKRSSFGFFGETAKGKVVTSWRSQATPEEIEKALSLQKAFEGAIGKSLNQDSIDGATVEPVEAPEPPTTFGPLTLAEMKAFRRDEVSERLPMEEAINIMRDKEAGEKAHAEAAIALDRHLVIQNIEPSIRPEVEAFIKKVIETNGYFFDVIASNRVKFVRYGSPSGNVWTAELSKIDGSEKTLYGIGKTKEDALNQIYDEGGIDAQI